MTTELWLGLITGVIFGVLLQQGRVARFEKQIGAMLFKDMTIFKFMLTAIIVGMIGVNILAGMELIPLSVKTTIIGANLIGGSIFGIGWAIMGYCPGTSLAAIGEGRWHAIWAVLGMLTGAALYAEVVPYLKDNILSWGNYGKITVPSMLGVSQWLVIPIMIAGFLCVFVLFEKKKI
jgi:uncharacterized protein